MRIRAIALADLSTLSDIEIACIAVAAGPTAMGRLCRLSNESIKQPTRSGFNSEWLAEYDRAAATPIPARLAFDAVRAVSLAADTVGRGGRQLVSLAVAAASRSLETAHARLHDLLKLDLSTRGLSGAQRNALATILSSLASAHGELWMSGGTEERARNRVNDAFQEAKTLLQSSVLDPHSRAEVQTALEDISEAGRLLGMDLVL